ncbi:MFS transporter [Bacillus sp. FJAT-49732]|uniref:MFS transporter n=1 Tax=Lederbergia citrisecunda TaxID=2833583 RepID=A0A942YL34_9BACI|nr:MFS transporter [Lederbergia citrisecunda]MBS4201048.1 MFS transporter [Lederbergia citrisecunda]
MKLKISMFYLFLYLGMGSFMPFMSLFLSERGFDGASIGLILGAGSLTGIIAQPVFGLINDAAKDYRTLLKVSTFLSAIAAFGYIFSESFIPMIITAIVFSFINTPAGTIVDAIAVEKGPSFGFTYGQVRLWGALGFAFVTVIAGYVYNSIGYQYSFIAFSIFAVIMFLLMFSFPKLERPKKAELLGKEGVGALFRNRNFIFFLVITMVISGTVTMNFSYLPIYFQKLNYPVDLVGWNFTIAAVVEIPLFWLSAKLIRRIGLFPMLILGTLAYAIKYIVMGFAPPVGVILSVQALDGLAFAFYFSSVIEIVNLMAPRDAKATAQTMFAAAGGLAGIAGNVIGGLIVDYQGPQFLFWMMGCIICVGTLFFIVFPKKGSYHLPTSSQESATGA